MAGSLWERLSWAAGGVFVVLVLVGNSLVADGTSGETELTAAQAAADAAVMAEGGINRVGIALELLAFAALLVFLGRVAAALTGPAGRVALTAGTAMVAVKLATGGVSLAAVAAHERLSDDSLLALTEVGSVGFVLSWLPYGVLVGALAVATGGRVTAGIGAVLGVLGVAAACAGINDPGSAMPVPFLLSLVLTLVISLRLAARGGVPDPA